MADFVKWQCPQCFQNYKLPTGRTPPAVCTNCAKVTDTQPEPIVIITEPPKPLESSFVRVEPAKAETFQEAIPGSVEPQPNNPQSKTPASKPQTTQKSGSSTIVSQMPGPGSSLILVVVLVVYLIAGLWNYTHDSSFLTFRRFEPDNAIGASANALEKIEREVRFFRKTFILYATGLTLIVAFQSLQYSRFSQEIWQLRYELALRDHRNGDDAQV